MTQRRVCSHEGCDAALRVNNKLGLCGVHRPMNRPGRAREPEYLAYQLAYRQSRREELAARQRARYAADPERGKDQQRNMRYALSVKDFDSLHDSQGGMCPGCLCPLPKYGLTVHVDHDHTCCRAKNSCGACVRGLLCRNCNLALGNMKDRPETAERLAAYLRSHG